MADYGMSASDDLMDGEDLISHMTGNVNSSLGSNISAEHYAMAYVFAAVGLLWLLGYSLKGK